MPCNGPAMRARTVGPGAGRRAGHGRGGAGAGTAAGLSGWTIVVSSVCVRGNGEEETPQAPVHPGVRTPHRSGRGGPGRSWLAAGAGVMDTGSRHWAAQGGPMVAGFAEGGENDTRWGTNVGV